ARRRLERSVTGDALRRLNAGVTGQRGQTRMAEPVRRDLERKTGSLSRFGDDALDLTDGKGTQHVLIVAAIRDDEPRRLIGARFQVAPQPVGGIRREKNEARFAALADDLGLATVEVDLTAGQRTEL